VKQILIVLGPNIIMPKDAYLLHFPTAFLEGPPLTARSCIQSVFKTLYNKDLLSSAVPLNTGTNLFLLFLLPRSCDHTRLNLLPRLTYNVPSFGILYEITLMCIANTVTLGTTSLSSPCSKELDISGIHPLDDSISDIARNNSDVLTIDPSANDDFVWFQASVTVKGYKEKLPDTVGIWSC